MASYSPWGCKESDMTERLSLSLFIWCKKETRQKSLRRPRQLQVGLGRKFTFILYPSLWYSYNLQFFLCKYHFYNKNVFKNGINNAKFSENLKWLHRIHDYSMIIYSKSSPNMAATNFFYSWMSMCIKRCTKGADLKSCLHKTKKVTIVFSDGC